MDRSFARGFEMVEESQISEVEVDAHCGVLKTLVFLCCKSREVKIQGKNKISALELGVVEKSYCVGCVHARLQMRLVEAWIEALTYVEKVGPVVGGTVIVPNPDEIWLVLATEE